MHGADGVDCDFCDIEGFRRTAEVLIETDLCIYASGAPDQADVLPGSGIVIPRAHRTTPFELTEAEWLATRALVVEARARVDERWQPDGYNLIWNVGEAGGQSVEHVHLHLIPRFADEPFAGRGGRSWIKQPENRRPDPSAPGSGAAR